MGMWVNPSRLWQLLRSQSTRCILRYTQRLIHCCWWSKISVLVSFGAGRWAEGVQEVILSSCTCVRYSIMKGAERREGGKEQRGRKKGEARGKKAGSPGKQHGSCQDVSLWLPSPTSGQRAGDHGYLPTLPMTRADWSRPNNETVIIPLPPPLPHRVPTGKACLTHRLVWASPPMCLQ